MFKSRISMDEFKKRFRETYPFIKDVVRVTSKVDPTYFLMRAVTKDCKYFFGFCSRYMYVLDWDNKEIMNIIFDRDNIGNSYVLYNKDRYIAAPSYNSKVKVWEVPYGNKPVFEYNGRGGPELIMIKRVEDGEYIFGASEKGYLYAWRLGESDPIMEVKIKSGYFYIFNISRNEKYIVLGYPNGWVYLYELGKRYPLFKVRAYERYYIEKWKDDSWYLGCRIVDKPGEVWDAGVTSDGENIVVLTRWGYLLIYFRGDRYRKHIRVMPDGRCDLVERYIKNDDKYEVEDCCDKIKSEYKIDVNNFGHGPSCYVNFINKKEIIFLRRELMWRNYYLSCEKYSINAKNSEGLKVGGVRYRWGSFAEQNVMVSRDGRYLLCKYRYTEPEQIKEVSYIKVYELGDDFNVKKELKVMKMEPIKDEDLMCIIEGRDWVVLEDYHGKKVKVRDINTWKLIYEFNLYKKIERRRGDDKYGMVVSVGYIPEKGWLVSAVSYGYIEVRNVDNGDLIYSWGPKYFLNQFANSMAISGDGRYAFVNLSDGDAFLFNLEERRRSHYFRRLGEGLRFVDVDDRGESLLGLFRERNIICLLRRAGNRYKIRRFRFESMFLDDDGYFGRFLGRGRFVVVSRYGIVILYEYNIGGYDVKEIKRCYLPGTAEIVDMVGNHLYVMNDAGDLMHIDLREL